jgi:PAS domain S-box-containing protein
MKNTGMNSLPDNKNLQKQLNKCTWTVEDIPFACIRLGKVTETGSGTGLLRILEANGALLSLLGADREKLVGRSLLDVLPGLSEPCFAPHYKRLLDMDSPHITVEFGFFHKETGRYFGLSGTLAEDKSVVLLFRDISRHRNVEDELKKSERRFRTLYENLKIGIYRTTPEGQIIMANPAMLDILGYKSFEELALRNLEEIGFDRHYPREKFKQKMEEKGEIAGFESTLIRRDGSRIYVRENSSSYRDDSGKIIYYEGTVEDITDKKTAEEQISRLNDLFINLGVDAGENIATIIRKTCDILDVTCVMYKRLDDARESRVFWAGDQIPPGVRGYEMPDARICHESLLHDGEGPVMVPDLEKTGLLDRHPALRKYRLRSFLGYPIVVNGQMVGSLCVADDIPRSFTDTEMHIVSTLAKAISLEHKRFHAEEDLRQSEQKYRSFVRNFHGIAFRSDLNFKPYFFHGNVKAITGFDEHDFLTGSMNWRKAVHPGDFRRILDETRMINSQPDFYCENEYRIIRKDGDVRWVRQHLRNISDENGKPVVVEGVIYDITNVKNYEEKLTIAKQEAEQANKAKSQFLANMSHEIRTPLNAIMGFSEILLSKEKDPTKVKMLRMIENSGQVLLLNVNDLLDLSKIEAGKINLAKTPFLISQAIQESISFFEEQVRAKNLDLVFENRVEPEPHLMGDPIRIKQIISNLISNAIKFTNQGSIRLSLEETKRKDTWTDVRITVSDTGIGIPPEHHEEIFDEFKQLDNYLTKKNKGTGLGLSIVKKLVDKMCGSITLHSEPGRGSTFILEIPFRIAKDHEVSGKTEEIPRTYLDGKLKLKILLAEDNEPNQFLIQSLVESANWDIVVVDNGIRAIEAYCREPFHMILMDVQMPEMDGYEATKKIRLMELNRGGHIPIIALTAYTMKSDIQKCFDSGMDDFIAKPFDRDHFFSTIQEMSRRFGL